MARRAAAQRTRSRRRKNTGIANRPLEEELHRQELLPPRGSRKGAGGVTQRFVEPIRARRRGRGIVTEVDVSASTPPTGEEGPQETVADYGRPRPAWTTATASARATLKKPNRRFAGDPTAT